MIYTLFSEQDPTISTVPTSLRPIKKQIGNFLYIDTRELDSIESYTDENGKIHKMCNLWKGSPVALITDFLPIKEDEPLVIPETINGLPSYLHIILHKRTRYDQFENGHARLIKIPDECNVARFERISIDEFHTLRKFKYRYGLPKNEVEYINDFRVNGYLIECDINTVFYHDISCRYTFPRCNIDTVIFCDISRIRNPIFDGDCVDGRTNNGVRCPRNHFKVHAPFFQATVNRIIFRCPRMKIIDNMSYIMGLEYVEIEPGPTEIAPKAFEGNPELRKVVLPSTITKVGKNAFRGCHPDLKLEYIQATVSEWNPEEFEEDEYEDIIEEEEELNWDEGNPSGAV